MIPVPAQIYSAATIPLQLLVTRSSVALARLLDIPILREGNLIHLPGHTLQVVQACSGLRSMISLVTLGTVLGYFTLSSNLLRSLLLLCGIPAAILVNIVRVVIMILAYHYLGLDLAEGAVHTVFGTLIFLLALALLFAAKGLFAKWDAPPSG
jgi:exosortase